jgi:hypothetical protein
MEGAKSVGTRVGFTGNVVERRREFLDQKAPEQNAM